MSDKNHLKLPLIISLIHLQHKIDCVAHFAALKAVGESCRLPLQYYQNNITGTSFLLEVMADNGVFNFVYSSSATVYGEPQYLPLTEDHPTGNCTNPYGKSKYFTEEILRDLCASDKVRNQRLQAESFINILSFLSFSVGTQFLFVILIQLALTSVDESVKILTASQTI